MPPNGQHSAHGRWNLENGHERHSYDDVHLPRKLYMLIPPSPLFAAHWSFFVPDALPFNPKTQRHEESEMGTRIHVSGDRLNGFELEIIRKYDFRMHRGVTFSRRFPVGLVSAEHLRPSDSVKNYHDAAEQRMKIKDEDEGGGFIDNSSTNAFEQACIAVEVPGPSLKSVSESSDDLSITPGRGVRSEVKDCQWWASHVVQTLYREGILKPISSDLRDEELTNPVDIIARLPKH